MKKLVCFVISMMMILSSVSVGAAKVGSVVGNYLHTDICAKIDHAPIQSYNINGNTAIIAEDLTNFGFNVVWNGAARTLTVTEGNKKLSSSFIHTKTGFKVGALAGNVLHTDIVTYVNGKAVKSFNIGGRTAIYIDDLAPYGSVKWDAAQRVISVTRNGGELLEATAADINKLPELLASLFSAMDDNYYYRYYRHAPDAARKATNMTLGYYYPYAYSAVYGHSELRQIYGVDPLRYFADGNSYYYALPAERVERVISELFSVEATGETFKNVQYKYGDKYYANTVPTDGLMRTVKYVKHSRNADGTYTISADSYYSVLGESSPTYLASYRVIAAVKQKNGARYWSIYSAEDVNNLSTAEPTSPDRELTPVRAEQIANDYFKNDTSYDKSNWQNYGAWLGETMTVNGEKYYNFHLKVLYKGEDRAYSADYLYINARTGELSKQRPVSREITEEQALNAAKNFWGIKGDSEASFLVGEYMKGNKKYYMVYLKVDMGSGFPTTADFVYVDALTGAVTYEV